MRGFGWIGIVLVVDGWRGILRLLIEFPAMPREKKHSEQQLYPSS